MGVGLVRSLQPADIHCIHWRVYNSIADTSKGVLFLPPSDAYVRGFLYLLYALINLITQRVWVTKPCLCPWIELFSSEGQEPRQLCVIHKQPFITNNPLNVIFSLYAESDKFSLPSLLFALSKHSHPSSGQL